LNAAEAWKRGEKKEAYDLWAKAAAGSKEHREKKVDKKRSRRSRHTSRRLISFLRLDALPNARATSRSKAAKSSQFAE